MEQESKSDKVVYWKESKPIKFIDELKDSRNISLFFEDPEFAKIIQFRFIKNGLEKNQTGLFIANEAQDVEIIKREMEDFGIDVKSYEKQDLLIFFQVPDPKTVTDGVSLGFYQDLLKVYEEKSKNNFRMTGTWILNVDSTRNTDSIIEIEAHFYNEFKNFTGHVLCSYSVLGLEPEKRGFLIEQITKHHNAVIFAPSIDNGLAFDLDE